MTTKTQSLLRLFITSALLILPFTPAHGADSPTPPAPGTTSAPPQATVQSGLTEIGQALANGTNWTVAAGYGLALTSPQRNIGFVDAAYNFTENVGLVLGYDYLWGSGSTPEWNDIRGGVTLSATIHPFAFLGSTFFTNIVATPFVGELLAMARSGNSIGNIVVTGAKWDIINVKNFNIGLLTAYEHRSGQGSWDGNYALIGPTISRKW